MTQRRRLVRAVAVLLLVLAYLAGAATCPGHDAPDSPKSVAGNGVTVTQDSDGHEPGCHHLAPDSPAAMLQVSAVSAPAGAPVVTMAAAAPHGSSHAPPPGAIPPQQSGRILLVSHGVART